MLQSHKREQRIAAVRRFNRFYTRQIGVLRKGYLDTPFSLAEARVLYELFRRPKSTASAIAATLDLDQGYLSRVLRTFEKRNLIARTASKMDARQSHLVLTARGRQAFMPLEKRSQKLVGGMLDSLDASAQTRLVAAMNSIKTLLDRQDDLEKDTKSDIVLRSPKPGDFGWIVKRHGEIYAQEYGWTEPFEALCAQIVSDFANNNDPKCERCWIAEHNGENAGTAMIVKDSPDVARLRLLLVEPQARGHGIAARLVDESIRFAHTARYKKITLWTHSVLTAARHIYEKAGFKLTSSEKRHTWSKDVVAEFWDLEL